MNRLMYGNDGRSSLRAAISRVIAAGTPLLLIFCFFLAISGCAKPLAEGKMMSTEPVIRTVPSDANTIYYAIKWAMDKCGYIVGSEDLTGGVIESQWVPTGAGSHYVDLFDGKDFGANAAYYKLVAKITPLEKGGCEVEVRTEVQSVVNKVQSTGDKERAFLDKLAQHLRGPNVKVTNLGLEE